MGKPLHPNAGATMHPLQGENESQLRKSTLSVPFIVAQNVRANRAESNQELAKFALLAMAPQRLK